MGSTLTVEVGTLITKASSPKHTEYEYGCGGSLVFRNHLHLPIPISNHNPTRQRQLSLLCHSSSPPNPNLRHVYASHRPLSISLCSPHDLTIRAEGEDESNDSEKTITTARAVVSEILQESGLSKEEALQIASNSPHYCQMLIDTVRELDDFSLWNSWFKDRQHILELQEQQKPESVVSLSFNQKVRCISLDKDE